MARNLTPRGRALRWLTDHRGITEDPPGSNWDHRADGIAAAIKRCGLNSPVPWCGVWHYNALRAAGVKGISSRQASVSLIESDARERRSPYGRGWTNTHDPNWHKRVLRGDAVVMFASGEHVETVRSTAWIYRKLGFIITDGGNTSSDNAGSQSNGGGAFRKRRRISDVYGFALVRYPND